MRLLRLLLGALCLKANGGATKAGPSPAWAVHWSTATCAPHPQT
jgi:hypothetical protein